MRGLRWLALLLIATMVAGLAAIAVLSRQEPPAPATSSLNDAAARIASAWPHPEQADLGALREDLRLVDASGREIPPRRRARRPGRWRRGPRDPRVERGAPPLDHACRRGR